MHKLTSILAILIISFGQLFAQSQEANEIDFPSLYNHALVPANYPEGWGANHKDTIYIWPTKQKVFETNKDRLAQNIKVLDQTYNVVRARLKTDTVVIVYDLNHRVNNTGTVDVMLSPQYFFLDANGNIQMSNNYKDPGTDVLRGGRFTYDTEEKAWWFMCRDEMLQKGILY